MTDLTHPTDVSARLAPTAAESAFLDRWLDSAGAERANKDGFLALCEALDLPRPEPKRWSHARRPDLGSQADDAHEPVLGHRQRARLERLSPQALT